MEKHRVNVYSECPYDKVSQCRITLHYATFENEPPFQFHYSCQAYHDGNPTCQKCIAFFSCYIDKYGIPEERQVIIPEIKR